MQPENADYLQALRTLEDVDIDEASKVAQSVYELLSSGLTRWLQPVQTMQVDTSRVEAAVRVLRMGDPLASSAIFSSECYADFLQRSMMPQERKRHEAMHAVRLCGEDSAGHAVVQIDGQKLREAYATGDLEAVFMHIVSTMDRVVANR